MEDKTGITYPDPRTDYHGHPSYTNVFLWLMVLFGISLVIGYLVSLKLAIVLIFLTAIIKAMLVARNFMHLRFEPWLIWVVAAMVFFVLFALFFGVFPDITLIERVIAK